MNINDFEDMAIQRGYTFRWHTERRIYRDFAPDTAFLIEIMKDDKVLVMYDAMTIKSLMNTVSATSEFESLV